MNTYMNDWILINYWRSSSMNEHECTCWGPTCEQCFQLQHRAQIPMGWGLSDWSDTRPAQRLLCGWWCPHTHHLKPPAPMNCRRRREANSVREIDNEYEKEKQIVVIETETSVISRIFQSLEMHFTSDFPSFHLSLLCNLKHITEQEKHVPKSLLSNISSAAMFHFNSSKLLHLAACKEENLR